MKKIMSWLSEVFAPKMEKVSKNIWVQSLQTSIVQTMPLIFVGSLATVFYVVKIYLKWFPDFSVVNNYTFGLMALIISFMLPYNVMEKKGYNKMKIVALFAGLGLYLLVLKPQVVKDGSVFNTALFGAQGMFIALITGFFTAIIMGLFANFTFFKKDTTIPDFIVAWFDSIIPVTIVIATGWILAYVVGIDIVNVILNVFKPIMAFAQTYFGFVLLATFGALVYSMGISPWVVFAFLSPIQYQAIAANAANVSAGKAPEFINTFEVMHSGWVCIGGTGSTFALVVFMAFLAKSAKFKAVGKASLVPSIMNINEPAVFGSIAWNPLLMIPMVLSAFFTSLVTYFALSTGLANIPAEVMQLWYLPFPISTWLMTQDVRGLILMVVCVAITCIIYYPFFKVADGVELKNEQNRVGEKTEW
ncbi:PTS sugar transporter subunit IIC [Caproiciproducens sp. CPB-2]|uniref:PTS sugar transporter subunit IIC n=1 Tax=Caproiciproducens sp. CPB-2 TaxID=3030017 RepID=UPI0023DAA2DD|nr:PTS transporter subunit EIIC [Caproiciproducens sp. CPB-2]MDF1493169.1 PTS transporter subunit EIIC [Caproiciproducens sp. CPB-2]